MGMGALPIDAQSGDMQPLAGVGHRPLCASLSTLHGIAPLLPLGMALPKPVIGPSPKVCRSVLS